MYSVHFSCPIQCLTQSFSVSSMSAETVALEKMVPRLVCFFALTHGIIIFYTFPFFMLYLLRTIFVGRLLRPFHSNQVSDVPLAMDSLGVCISLWCTACRWLDHSSICCVDGLSISSSVSFMKILLDLIRFFGTVWPCSRCLIFSAMCKQINTIHLYHDCNHNP